MRLLANRYTFALALVFMAPWALGAMQQPGAAKGGAKAGAQGKPNTPSGSGAEVEFPRPTQDTYTPKSYSNAEVQRLCRKYEGQIVAYYSDVYKVVGCEKRPITNNKTIYEYLRSGGRIADIDPDAIAALPEGEPLDLATSVSAARGCRALEGKYVTFSSVDIYFVEHCKRRVFPDWATYIKHREQRGDKKGEILSLSWIEFDRLPAGEPVPSIVDDVFAKMLSGDAGVEVIPVDEACAGLEGKIASYYSRVYRIERCRKREISSPELFFKRMSGGPGKVQELTGEQWLSLPDGAPIQVEPMRRGQAKGEENHES